MRAGCSGPKREAPRGAIRAALHRCLLVVLSTGWRYTVCPSCERHAFCRWGRRIPEQLSQVRTVFCSMNSPRSCMRYRTLRPILTYGTFTALVQRHVTSVLASVPSIAAASSVVTSRSRVPLAMGCGLRVGLLPGCFRAPCLEVHDSSFWGYALRLVRARKVSLSREPVGIARLGPRPSADLANPRSRR